MHWNPRVQVQVVLTSARTILAVAAALLLLVGIPAPASAESSDPPTALAEAVNEALESWSLFVATGDLESLRAGFVVGGPQWRQFESESRSVVDPPQQFILHDVGLRRLGGTAATVWAEVEVTRRSHVAETFGWDFDLVYQDGRWLVWTVVAGERPTASELPTAWSTTTSVVTPTPTEKASNEPGMDRGVRALTGGSLESPGTHIPALSAWIVVVTVIGVAAAGYVAPRLDRRRE